MNKFFTSLLVLSFLLAFCSISHAGDNANAVVTLNPNLVLDESGTYYIVEVTINEVVEASFLEVYLHIDPFESFNYAHIAHEWHPPSGFPINVGTVVDPIDQILFGSAGNFTPRFSGGPIKAFFHLVPSAHFPLK